MRARLVVAFLFAAFAAGAQQRPLFDPDDFIDPRHHELPVFISRVVIGAMRSAMDDYRPLRQDTGFLLVSNGIYWSRYEIDYKHTEVRGENANAPEHLQVCPCDPPLFFPTPPPDNATPNPPLPGGRDALQFAWYRSHAGAPSDPSIMLRTRITISRRKVDAETSYLDTGHRAFRLRGHEQSIGIESDVSFRWIRGSVAISRMKSSGTAADRSQSEITYTNVFPARTIGPLLVRGTLAVGGVTGRGANGLNVINPAVEAFVYRGAGVHLIWSPIATRSGAEGWVTHHQILLSIERSLITKLLALH
jgi:hypothetical protein